MNSLKAVVTLMLLALASASKTPAFRSQESKLEGRRFLKSKKGKTAAKVPSPTGSSVSSPSSPTSSGSDRADDAGNAYGLEPGRYSSGMVLADGRTYSFGGVWESSPCEDFDSAEVQALVASTTDSCVTNSCSGCCRIRSGRDLICDAYSIYSNAQCVCNSHTFDYTGLGTPAPVDPIIVATPEPTPAPVVSSLSPVTASPVDRATGDGTDGIDTGVEIIYNDTDTSETVEWPASCLTNARGQGWGVVPDSSVVLPEGLSPGDCTSNSHCSGAGVCCMQSLCICAETSSCMSD
eukprot:Nitzschia sp. Nitz4//scaffold19_size178191//54847//55807//NITZ4_001967-RA/size178191-augustus-gene-0.49-mRNA-1//1//CDS//3329540649//31//frame0